tara:strand:+ start:270 stop:533 length:264 start_codon:yes stop_codon:yes gene_type:complete
MEIRKQLDEIIKAPMIGVDEDGIDWDKVGSDKSRAVSNIKLAIAHIESWERAILHGNKNAFKDATEVFGSKSKEALEDAITLIERSD